MAVLPARRRPARRSLSYWLRGALPLLLLAACSAIVLEPLPKSPTVVLELPHDGVADGESLTRIVVHADTTLAVDKRTVALTTTAGTLVGDASSLIPDDVGIVIAFLRAPSDSTIALVRATVNGSATSGEIVFHRALPDHIDLVPAQFALKAGVGNEMNIVATVRRSVGVPSPGARVTFSATDTSADHHPVGLFIPASALSDAAGTVTVRFSTADSTVRGPVTIRAVADSVTASAVVQVVAP
jgi:hypothetical protein